MNPMGAARFIPNAPVLNTFRLLKFPALAAYFEQHSKRIMQHKLAQHTVSFPLSKQDA